VSIFKKIEEGTTTVHDSSRLKEILVGIILISVAAGIAIGVLLVLGV
jgi:hypothetical protein